ncbi:MAG TPA: ATP-binding cassette domain-containing protein [Actinomycetota bacterium]|jgi:ABC-type branched-subunit amino acid transport system ATPase component/branched-subunit amino acid ABC-type transport system permease component|nr:ATP-binding cassette domain-containing protein [Actinomycetota bacterium]
MTSSGFEIPIAVIVLGTIVGMTYGLLAVGLVLVYRSSRIINFAHGEIGAFAAAFFASATTRWHVPYYAAFVLALLVGGGTAAGAEAAVVRRLRNAPRLMSIVATLGVGQVLLGVSPLLSPEAKFGAGFPEPPALPTFTIGALRVTQAYTGVLFLAPVLVLGLVLFLRRTRYGLGIRSAAANADTARMSGVPASRMSSLAWALAGAVSAFTAILISPTLGRATGGFGPTLLLRAMAGAVIARMTNLPVALAAGVGLGIVEQVLLWNYPQSGLVEIALFVIILGALLFVPARGAREEEKGSWAAVQAWRPLPESFRKVFAVRHLGLLAGGGSLVIAALLPLVVNNSTSIKLVGIIAFTIVGLSVGIITGLGGQLTLGQFALAAIGAVVSYHVTSRVGNIGLGFVYAGLAAAAASLVIGLPALRIRGLMLTVTTLSFALVTPAWVLVQPWMFGEGVAAERPEIAGRVLDSGKSYYYFALLILVLVFVIARNVRRGGFGRLLVSVRDNEDNARAFTVRADAVKIQAFLLAGFVAGIGGALYGHLLSEVGASSFPTVTNINVVAITVIGGIGILAGPLIGALYIIGVPAFIPLDSAGLVATQFGWLLLVLYVPGGVAQLVRPLRDRVAARLAARAGVTADDDESPDTFELGSVAAGTRVSVVSTNGEVARRRPGGAALLEARSLSKSYGGVLAVDDVSVRVDAGETVGLIGPNGAGKTTLFELLGGFTRPDGGRVFFDGEDVSRLGPSERGRLGLIRSFQDAALFPTMTVIEAVQLALERTSPTSFFGSAAGFMGAERRKERRAREIVSSMGLDAYRNKQIQELSTGTRRITEIACLIALQPTLLLLDEPSSGIAQRETEALGRLLDDLKRRLSLTLFVIEHDIPLIMGISDRVFAMDAGRIIAAGAPTTVRRDRAVVEAYLGGDVGAIKRSSRVSVK